MYKKLTILIALCCFVGMGLLMAQSNKSDIKALSDNVIKAKAAMVTSLKAASMPIASEVILAKQPAKPFTVDVSGLDSVVLITWTTENGFDWDFSAWCDAYFITNDGKKVWLDEMPTSYEISSDQIRRNQNLNGKKLAVAGKTYDHGIFAHANTEMVFQLGGKYKSFHAMLGIDDSAGGSAGSVVFKAQNLSGELMAGKLAKQYQLVGQLLYRADSSGDAWLSLIDASVERRALDNVVGQLADRAYFEAGIAKVDALSSGNEKIAAYIDLFEQANRVLLLQDDVKWINPKTIAAALQNMKRIKGYNAAPYEAKLAELEALYNSSIKGIYSGDEKAISNLSKMVALKREILLSNPHIANGKVVAGKFNLGSAARRAMAPELGTQANNWSNQSSARRTGFDAEIVEISDLAKAQKTRTIYKPSHSTPVSDLMLHWDADRVMFSATDDSERWQVYEVGTDGKNLRQVTRVDEPDLEFFDAAYLPSGKIVAVSNIGYQGVPCVDGSDAVGNLVLLDTTTQNIRRLTFDQDANWNPVVMNNGRMMYVRWEYTDLTHYFSRIVMHANPDGTETKALYGSGSLFPNSTFDIRPIPGSSTKFVGVISGHHGVARSGRMIVFDPAKGRKEVQGMACEIPFSKRPIVPLVLDELVKDVWPQFVKPYPIDDNYFLVAAKLHPDALWGIYLVDTFDNVTLVAEQEGYGFISPMIVEKRPTPPVIPDKVNLAKNDATVFIQDVYEGEGLVGVPRGTIKKLRVFTYEYAYVKSPSNHYAQGIQSGWDIKRLIGTVDVEPDGSAIFTVPANTPLSLQPLDSEGRAVQWMRSWFTAMPGENVSCIGCHEDQNSLPIPKRVAASMKAPQPITATPGGTHSFTFDYEIQPILDRTCVACHDGSGKLDLRGGKKDEFSGFGTSYLALHPFINRQGPEADMYVMKPYEYHASTSELVRMLKVGHYGVELTDAEWGKLYEWIDLNAPDKGRFETHKLDGVDQICRRQELAAKYNNAAVYWQEELRDYAEYLAKQPKAESIKPNYVRPEYKDVKVKGFPFDALAAVQLQGAKGKKVVEIADGVTITFTWVPAGEFVMGSNVGMADNAPEHKAVVKDGFWMAEAEITNEQYAVVDPKHDSRIYAQFWKDHTTPGYPANRPGQPVIRVNWQQAMDYCRQISEKTGLKITLPTEIQWEWAARGGSDGAFWFGNLNTDFAKYENMADEQLSKMAVTGINPQPMKHDDPWFSYYNYLPRSAGVDDGNMIPTEGKKYLPNPWGLYDMHGNIAEWTASDYVKYPLSAKTTPASSDYKVVRGGSWIDRARNSTVYSRKAFYPWQSVNNLGFRVILED